jgi:hypothetical protein
MTNIEPPGSPSGLGVVPEVEPVVGADLYHPAGQTVEQGTAVGADTAFHEEAGAGVEAGEEQVPVTHRVKATS